MVRNDNKGIFNMEPIWWLAGIFLIFVSAVICTKARRAFPVSVNCWFCNQNTKVNYVLRNSWNCPYCEQYNGFDKDGGYNKILEEQYTFVPSGKVYNVSMSSSKEVPIKNGLCDMCNLNQQLKIQQLAQFVPISEGSYDKEIEQYRNLLEKSYHLCTNCEQIVDRTLKSQRFKLNIPPDSHFEKQAIENIIVTKNISKSREKFKSIFKFFSNFILLWLNIISVSGNNMGDYFAWREYITVYQVILESEKFIREVSCLGFLSYCLSVTDNSISGIDRIHLIFWSLIHAISWSSWTSLRSAACFMLLILTLSSNFLGRKLQWRVKKSLLQVGKRNSVSENVPVCSYDTSEGKKSFENGRKEEPESSPTCGKSREIQKFQAADPKTTLKNFGRTELDKFFSTSVTGRFQDAKPPVNYEKISSGLTNLKLGAAKEKEKEKEKENCNRSANFLFQTRNFAADKKKNFFPLLKPAKFFAGTTNFFPSTEYEESVSRSSTPSLYVNRKCESFDPKDAYYSPSKGYFPMERTDFVNRLNDFDYLGNNCYPWSDSVYACGMQTNFPIPPRNYVCDSVCSPVLSKSCLPESVETKSPAKNRPEIRSFFYALSLFLNLTTLLFLVYRLWPDLILFDFKVPDFKFYI